MSVHGLKHRSTNCCAINEFNAVEGINVRPHGLSASLIGGSRGDAKSQLSFEGDMAKKTETSKRPQQVFTLLVEVGRCEGDGLPETATGAALMCYSSGVDEAEAVRETVALLKRADLAPLDVTGSWGLKCRAHELFPPTDYVGRMKLIGNLARRQYIADAHQAGLTHYSYASTLVRFGPHQQYHSFLNLLRLRTHGI